MKIYTKKGDLGETSLYQGERVPKCHLRIQICGQIDSLNCQLGLLRAYLEDDEIDQRIFKIQNQLFSLGADIANAKNHTPLTTEELELWIDEWEEILPPLKNFILPGGHISAAYAHVARAQARNCERQLAALYFEHKDAKLAPAMAYLNRLSDFFFVLARFLNLLRQEQEVIWTQESL